MKRCFKKLLAFMLTICMVLSFAPQVSATQGEPSYHVSFNQTSWTIGEGQNAETVMAALSTGTAIDTSAETLVPTNATINLTGFNPETMIARLRKTDGFTCNFNVSSDGICSFSDTEPNDSINTTDSYIFEIVSKNNGGSGGGNNQPAGTTRVTFRNATSIEGSGNSWTISYPNNKTVTVSAAASDDIVSADSNEAPNPQGGTVTNWFLYVKDTTLTFTFSATPYGKSYQTCEITGGSEPPTPGNSVNFDNSFDVTGTSGQNTVEYDVNIDFDGNGGGNGGNMQSFNVPLTFRYYNQFDSQDATDYRVDNYQIYQKEFSNLMVPEEDYRNEQFGNSEIQNTQPGDTTLKYNLNTSYLAAQARAYINNMHSEIERDPSGNGEVRYRTDLQGGLRTCNFRAVQDEPVEFTLSAAWSYKIVSDVVIVPYHKDNNIKTYDGFVTVPLSDVNKAYASKEAYFEHFQGQEIRIDKNDCANLATVPFADGYDIYLKLEPITADECFVGNFGWSNDPRESETDKYIGNSRLELVSVKLPDEPAEFGEDAGKVLTPATGNNLTRYQFQTAQNNERTGSIWVDYQSESTNVETGVRGGEMFLPSGSQVTMVISPEYGYQVTAFKLREQDSIAPAALNTFVFTVGKGNYHIGADVEKIEDKATANAQTVDSASVALDAGILDHGTAELTVNNANLSSAKKAQFDAEATAANCDIKDVYDIKLTQVDYQGKKDKKGNMLKWETPVEDLGGKYATVKLSGIDESLAPKDGEKLVVVHNIHDGEKMEIIDAEYDAKTQTATFKAPGFSAFALATAKIEKPAEPATTEAPKHTEVPNWVSYKGLIVAVDSKGKVIKQTGVVTYKGYNLLVAGGVFYKKSTFYQDKVDGKWKYFVNGIQMRGGDTFVYQFGRLWHVTNGELNQKDGFVRWGGKFVYSYHGMAATSYTGWVKYDKYKCYLVKGVLTKITR